MIKMKAKIIEYKETTLEPYLFDYSCELHIYESVGKRKAEYEKYSQWEKHIKEKYQNQLQSNDFYHFLRRKYRIKKNKYEMTKALLVPIEVAIIAVFAQNENMIGCISIGTIIAIIIAFVIVFMVSGEMTSCKNEINFLNDIIEIINKTQEGERK